MFHVLFISTLYRLMKIDYRILPNKHPCPNKYSLTTFPRKIEHLPPSVVQKLKKKWNFTYVRL